MAIINSLKPYFYYLTDRLGSSSYITDDNGSVTQTLAYMPYGEDNGYKANHQKGINSENKVNGTTRKKESYNRGTYTTDYTNKNWKTTTYSYSTQDAILKARKK